jgi:hypothetical protein
LDREVAPRVPAIQRASARREVVAVRNRAFMVTSSVFRDWFGLQKRKVQFVGFDAETR